MSTFMERQIAEQIERNKPIKTYANNAMYSDTEPYEVIKICTENKVIVRQMQAERSPDWKPNIVAGGFSGHCTNNDDQRNAWVIEPWGAGREVTIRWSKAKRQWQSADGSRFYMSDHPVKHYDFNF